jgi:hypothetical protein
MEKARRTRRRTAAVVALAALPVVALLFVAARTRCPAGGVSFTAGKAALSRLKNRDAAPRAEDFDPRATLAALLQPGDDRARWSVARAARIEAYVVAVGEARVESANCYARRDIHIDVGARPDAPLSERVVLEVTPRWRDAARSRGEDWSADALARTLTGRLCRFEGWLFFDAGHTEEAENTAPGRAGNWRATAWEIHPVTRIECEWELGVRR